jgi:hypothetical protein
MLLPHGLRAALSNSAVSPTPLVGGVFLENQASNSTRTLTYSGHQIGDMLVAHTANRLNTAPTLLSGYTNIVTAIRNTVSFSNPRGLRVQYKIATSTSETISWTGAYGYLLALRGISRIGASNSISNTNNPATTIPLPDLTSLDTTGVGFILAGHVNTTSVVTSVSSPYETLILDNGSVTSQFFHKNNTDGSLTNKVIEFAGTQFSPVYAVEFLP